MTLEGVVLGTALFIVTTCMLFKNHELFLGAGGGFSIPWVLRPSHLLGPDRACRLGEGEG